MQTRRAAPVIRDRSSLPAVIAGLVLLACLSLPGAAWGGVNRWTSNGPVGGFIARLAVDPRSPTTVYAAVDFGGVFRSTDGGATWAALGGGLPRTEVTALAVGPFSPSTLYVSTPSSPLSGTYRSTDGGATWMRITGLTFSTILFDPLTPGTIYGVTGKVVIKSTDGGGHLGPRERGASLQRRRARDRPRGVEHPLCQHRYVRIFKTTNGGASWAPINNGVTNLGGGALAIDPTRPAIVYANTGAGLLKTTTGGASWSPVGTGLPGANVLAVDPSSPDRVYAVAFTAGIFRSLDGGVNWNNVVAAHTDDLTLAGWGTPALGDIAVPADYDGDGITDFAVYRRLTGEWYLVRSMAGFARYGWGSPALGDVPVPADYDADGAADIAIFRQTTGEWFIRLSSTGFPIVIGWGTPAVGDVPVPGYYDGDLAAELAVYRTTTGQWLIRRAVGGALVIVGWGSPALGDVPINLPPALRVR